MSVRRVEVTVPTYLPLPDASDPDLKPGCWVATVVEILKDEKYVRFPARDGLEYDRIHTAFQAADTDDSGTISRVELSGLLMSLNAHPKQLAHLKQAAFRSGVSRTQSVPQADHDKFKLDGPPPATPRRESSGLDDVHGVGGKSPKRVDPAVWDHDVQLLFNSMTVNAQNEVSFEEFRNWWPRDDTTVFSVVTVHAQELLIKLTKQGIGTKNCHNTFIAMGDLMLSNPMPPDMAIEEVSQAREQVADSGTGVLDSLLLCAAGCALALSRPLSHSRSRSLGVHAAHGDYPQAARRQRLRAAHARTGARPLSLGTQCPVTQPFLSKHRPALSARPPGV